MAYGIVKLQDCLTAQAHGAFTPESLVWISGHVNIVGAEVHEEGTLLIVGHELYGLGYDAVGYILVAPESFASSFHVTDASYPIDYALVMTVAGL